MGSHSSDNLKKDLSPGIVYYLNNNMERYKKMKELFEAFAFGMVSALELKQYKVQYSRAFEVVSLAVPVSFRDLSFRRLRLKETRLWLKSVNRTVFTLFTKRSNYPFFPAKKQQMNAILNGTIRGKKKQSEKRFCAWYSTVRDFFKHKTRNGLVFFVRWLKK